MGSREQPLWPALSRDLAQLCARSCLQQQIGSGSNNLHISAVRLWLTAAGTARVHDINTQRRGCTTRRGSARACARVGNRERECCWMWRRRRMREAAARRAWRDVHARSGSVVFVARVSGSRWVWVGVLFWMHVPPPPLPPPTLACAFQLQLRVQVTFTEVRGQAVTSPAWFFSPELRWSWWRDVTDRLVK